MSASKDQRSIFTATEQLDGILIHWTTEHAGTIRVVCASVEAYQQPKQQNRKDYKRHGH